MGKGTRNKAQRALARLAGRGKGKDVGPWPVCAKTKKRLDIIKADFERENHTLQVRAQSRVEEALAILRPDDLPEEAVFNAATRQYVLPEKGPDGQPVLPETEEEKTPEQQAADEAFEAERAKARDAILDEPEDAGAGPDPAWTE